jgi:replicative DNA helicase
MTVPTTAVVGSASIEEAEPIPHYDFDDLFQQKITAMMIRDTQFAQLTEGLIRPEFFENAGFGALIKVSGAYFDKYKKCPGDKTVLYSLIGDAVRAKTLPADLAKIALSVVPDIMATDVSDRDYVANQCATFARHQATARAILDSVDLIEKRDFDAIEKRMGKALSTGVNISAGSYDYEEMRKARSQERREKAAGTLPPTGITTGFPMLDGYLYHKGWGRREMAVLMGGPKSGKSMAMISFGINAIANGYKVLYVTLEVSSQIIAERMDANISERAMMELGLNIDEVDEKVAAFMSKAAPFKIEEFPSGTMKPSDLRRLIERYKAQGMIFDLVIVDYADLMAPENWTDNVQENSKSVYVSLRGLAMQEGYALLTATQTNREGAKKAVATMTDVAEDLNKIRIADIVISINKSDDERAMNQARLHFAASRNQRSGFSVRVEQNIDQGRFISKVIGED